MPVTTKDIAIGYMTIERKKLSARMRSDRSGWR